MKQPEPLSSYTEHRARSPWWSPDGSQLIFISDISGTEQAWQLTLDTGETKQLTFFEAGVDFICWSPTGEYILVSGDSGGNERFQLYLVLVADGAIKALTHAPRAIHHFGAWSPDGSHICYASNERHPMFFDIYEVDVPSGKKHCVLEQDAMLLVGGWSPDGSMLLICRVNTFLDTDLFLLSLHGEYKLRLLTSHEEEVQYLALAFSPTGNTLYALTNYQHEFFTPAALDLTTQPTEEHHVPIQFLQDTIWDCEHLALSPRGDILAWAENRDGYSQLIFYHIGANKVLAVPTLPKGVINTIHWRPGQDQVAYSFTGTHYNENIWLASLEKATISQATNVPMRSDMHLLREPELIRYPSFDSLQIPAYYYKPLSSSDSWPVIIFVHGGPTAQFRPLNHAPWLPDFLQRGFAVFAPNVRGSSGYGKRYIHLDDVERRPDSVADLRAAVDWLSISGGADKKRISIMGRSYGGYMVLAAITEYPSLWASAVDIVGIANFVTFLENTSLWRRKMREAEYGSLERDRAVLERISPIHAVDRITTPLLVIHGANDPRVPVSEAEQIVEALRSHNIPVKYQCFENEGHFLDGQTTQYQMYTAIGDWFEQHIQSPSSENYE